MSLVYAFLGALLWIVIAVVIFFGFAAGHSLCAQLGIAYAVYSAVVIVGASVWFLVWILRERRRQNP